MTKVLANELHKLQVIFSFFQQNTRRFGRFHDPTIHYYTKVFRGVIVSAKRLDELVQFFGRIGAWLGGGRSEIVRAGEIGE